MPYATPTSPVGTLSAAPSPTLPSFSILQHSFSALPSTSNNIPSAAVPASAFMFNYDSNTSLDALPSIPRRRPAAIPATGGTGNIRFRSSAQDPKRVRTANFAIGGADSPSASDNNAQASRPRVSSPIGEGGVNMSAMGRKRGEMMMRQAVSMDIPRSPNEPPAASSVLAHSETVAPVMMFVTNATPPVMSPVSPNPPHGDASGAAYSKPKTFQAIVAGQKNVLKLNMDAIKRARSASPSTAAAAAASGSSSTATYLSPASTTDGKPKFNTIGPSSVQFVRKKSGELVKPALRTSRTYCQGDGEERSPCSSTMSPSSSSALMYRRNSAPTTPTPKNVHFDSRLEHVKLFLAEQKPAAVSRSGSPDPTLGSTTEDEGGVAWPKRGGAGEKKAEDEGELVVKVVNAASCSCSDEARGPYSSALKGEGEVDVKMESLVLGGEDGKTLKGSVVVRNWAYDKRVAARFTLDWWQTTSEVVGRYVEGVSSPPSTSTSPSSTSTLFDPAHAPTPLDHAQPPASHDRFAFSIKLGDCMNNKIEERTMFLAVRYISAGREVWDNNAGGNYEVRFERVVRRKEGAVERTGREGSPTKASSGSPTKAASGSPTKGSPTKERREWSPTKSNVELQMADLRKELERAVLEDGDSGAEGGRRPLFRKDSAYQSQMHATPGPMRKAKTLTLPLPPSNQSSPSMSPHPALPSPSCQPPTLSTQLSTRYDLSTASSRKWTPPASTTTPVVGGSWTPSAWGLGAKNEVSWSPAANPEATWNPPPLPSTAIRFGGRAVPFPRRSGSASPPEARIANKVMLPLGSPRDRRDHYEEVEQRGRNHRRGTGSSKSYFDTWARENVKLTPPGTPKDVWVGEPRVESKQQVGLGAEEQEEDLRDEEEVAAALMMKPSNSTGSIASMVAEEEEGKVDGLGFDLSTQENQPRAATVVEQPRTIFAPRPQKPTFVPAYVALESETVTGDSSPVEESIASTPSATSASSPDQSPSSPSHSLPTSPPSCFIDGWCYFRPEVGSVDGDHLPAGVSGLTRRNHSESDVDSYFARPAHSESDGGVYHFSRHRTWVTSPLCGGGSGAATPTSGSPTKGSITPRAGTPLSSAPIA